MYKHIIADSDTLDFHPFPRYLRHLSDSKVIPRQQQKKV